MVMAIGGFCLGAMLASLFMGWWLMIVPAGLLLPLILRHSFIRRSASLVLSIVAMVFGMTWVNYHWQSVSQQALAEDQGRINILVTGEVAQVSVQSHRTQFDFMPSGAEPFNKIQISCYKCPYLFQHGQQWQLALKLKPIVSFHNPNGFDYRRWMLSKDYGARGFVDMSHGHNRLLKQTDQRLLQLVNVSLPLSSQPLTRALLLGDKQGLSANIKRFIYSSGISHLFVVSGLHIGTIALFMVWLFSWLQRPLLLLNWQYSSAVAMMLASGFALFYGYLSGFNVPATRACLMLLFLFVYLKSGGGGNPLYYWLWALLLVVLMQPLAFMDMGSWLSFIIVFGLLLFSHKQYLSSKWRLLLHAQWVAFICGSLVLLGFFQSISPLGFALNIVLIPLMALVLLPLTFISLLLALVGWADGLQFMESAFQILFAWLIDYQSIFGWWPVIHEDSRFLILVGLILLILPRVLRQKTFAYGVLITGLILPAERPETGGFKLTVLDVGQGSSAIIQTQNHNVLVDTGLGFKSGLGMADYVVMPQLKRSGIRRLDLLHLTHEDNDHAGGAKLLQPLSDWVIRQSTCESQNWVWDGVIFQVFQAKGFKSGNDGSCLLKVTSAVGQSVLFAGDIEKPAERALLKHNKEALSADILMVPHHGSISSSSPRFIKAVDPQIGLVSAGLLNPYGHPHEQVLTRYKQKMVKIYSTGPHGAMEVRFAARQVPLVVSTYRPDLDLSAQ